MKPSIAVIGAAGFVGARLVESLVLDGEVEVRAVVRAYRSMASLSRFGATVPVHLADAADAASLAPALRGASAVVNLTTGTPANIVQTTKAILAACEAENIKRLIHLSSAVVYGEVASPNLDDDAPPLGAHWMPYARAKSAAEIFLKSRLAASATQIALLRPGIVWGVRSPHTLHAVKGLLDKSAYLVDEGAGIFNSVYIDNLVACIRACCDHDGDVRGFHNVGDEETVTWREFYTALAGPLGYDMQRMPRVRGDRFPWSARAAVDYVHSLPFVNGLYHVAKTQLPDALKARLRSWLAGRYRYDATTSDYAAQPRVERELWHLQKVKHKLPCAKFGARFGFTPPVTFDEGIRKTLSWLAFLGYVPSEKAVTNER